MKPTPPPAVKEPFPASFFALLDRRHREHQQAEALARKSREDAKLARMRPWWAET